MELIEDLVIELERGIETRPKIKYQKKVVVQDLITGGKAIKIAALL